MELRSLSRESVLRYLAVVCRRVVVPLRRRAAVRNAVIVGKRHRSPGVFGTPTRLHPRALHVAGCLGVRSVDPRGVLNSLGVVVGTFLLAAELLANFRISELLLQLHSAGRIHGRGRTRYQG